MTGGTVGEIPAEYRGRRGLSAEARRVLGQPGTATLGTHDDGMVHLAQVWFLYEEPGLVYFESSSATKKVRNVLANGRASILVKGKQAGGGSLLVLGQGTGRVLPEADGRAIVPRIREKYISPAGAEPMARFLDRIDDVVVELRPEKWVSWFTGQVNDAIRNLPEYRDGAWDEWFNPEDVR